MSKDEQVMTRIPLLQRHHVITIARADHGGYLVQAGEGTAAFSVGPDLLEWLRHVLVRWQPVVELIPPVPRSSTVMIPHDEPYIAPTVLGVLISKRGYFYRPDWAGYTKDVGEAGRYDPEVAARHVLKTEGTKVHQPEEFMHLAVKRALDT